MEAPTWKRGIKNLLTWGCIGTFLLFFGGLAAHGYHLLMTPCTNPDGAGCPGRMTDWLALGELSVGGGIAIALIGLALTLANPRGVGLGLGIVVIGSLLFLIFVWPTPYKYYRDQHERLIRVHRVTGRGDYVPDQRVQVENTEPTQHASAPASQK